MMMTMMSCLSVCNVGRPYSGQTVAYFSYCSAELLFIDPGVHMMHGEEGEKGRGRRKRRGRREGKGGWPPPF